MSFWGELKRRNVYKVGVAYAIVAWLLIQFAAIAFPHLNFPSWAVPFVIIILIIGFPVVLIIAWAFEVTPEGIKRTKEVPLSESITHLTGKKLNYILAGLLMLAIAYFVYDKFYLDRRATVTEKVPTETEQVPAVVEVKEAPKTIAVLPFDNLSSDPEQEYFVLGLSEEILSSLTQIPDLLVTAKTSSFAFKGTDKTVQDIAEVLGVAHILEGSVRKAGNALRITAQLIRASDGFHLWSETYDRELKDIFAVQEDIATAIADELKVTLGINDSIRLLGGTDNVEAYELYLIVQGQMWQPIERGLDVYNSMQMLEKINKAIALDPEFALAWVAKSSIHDGLIARGPTNRADMEQEAALSAVQKAIELEPNLPAGYYVLVRIKISTNDWVDAGLAFRKTLGLQTDSLSGYEFNLSSLYDGVGYLKKSREIIEEARRKDPLNSYIRADYVHICGILGDIQQAEEEYERGKAMFGDQWDLGDERITYLRLSVSDAVSVDDIVYSTPIFNAVKDHLDSPKEGLAELHKLYSDENNLSESDITDISICAAYFDDTEFAMDAMEKGIRINGTGLFKIWVPVMKDVRQLPRFKEFIKEIGLVDYWNKFGWPDICHKLDNGDFECD